MLHGGLRRAGRLCVSGIQADAQHCLQQVHNSTATITALVDSLGHEAADELACLARQHGKRHSPIGAGGGA